MPSFLVVARRMMSDYKVEMMNDGMQEFFVDFHGPNESTSFTTHESLMLVSFRPRSGVSWISFPASGILANLI